MHFAVFAVDVGNVADRLGVSLTLVLASVAYKYVVSDKLPNISYLTLCDFYVLGSFFFTALVVCQNAVVSLCGSAKDYDKVCLWSDVSLFAAANVAYLCFVLHVLR